MKTYAVVGPNGKATAFYRDDIHADIPEGAVEISTSQHAAMYEAAMVATPLPSDGAVALRNLARDRLKSRSSRPPTAADFEDLLQALGIK